MYSTRVADRYYVTAVGHTPGATRQLEQQLLTLGGTKVGHEYAFPISRETRDRLHKIAAYNKYMDATADYPEHLVDRDKVPHLRDYQIPPLQYMLTHGGRVLLSDDVGLGKTLTSLGYFQYTKTNYPLLVICPVSLKLQWAREAVRFDPDVRVHICEGTKSLTSIDADIVVINYDILSRHVKKDKNRYVMSDDLLVFKNNGFRGLILDECQRIKSFNSLWTHAIHYLAQDIPNILGLSATPIENGPIEFFSILSLLRPDLWHNYQHFGYRYCDGKIMYRTIRRGYRTWKQEYMDFTGASNLEELNVLLDRHVMFRRKNKDAIEGLPKIWPVPLHVSIKKTERNLYNEILDADEWDGKELTPLTRMSKLKIFCGEAKVPYIVTFLKDFLADTDKKIVVFTEHHAVVDELHEAFKKESVVYDGRMSAAQKNEARDKFVEKDKRIFLGQITAAGVGLDGLQTVCDTILYAELPYKPSAIKQGNGRVERVGSTSAQVTVYFPIIPDTVEEKIIDKLVDKSTNMFMALDGEDDDMNIARQVKDILVESRLDT